MLKLQSYSIITALHGLSPVLHFPGHPRLIAHHPSSYVHPPPTFGSGPSAHRTSSYPMLQGWCVGKYVRVQVRVRRMNLVHCG
jgi:hypothetical protein